MKNPIAAIQAFITAIQRFYGETVEQLKKCSWPTSNELYESTALIVSATVLLTLFVMVADWLCELAVRYATVGL